MNNKGFDDEIEIDLLALFRVLLRKWWLIAICAVIGASVAIAVTILLITPQYQSKAMLYVLNKTTSVTSLSDIQIGSELTKDFEVIAKSKSVIDGAIENIKKEEGKSFTREEIYGMLTVGNESGTRILVITATSENPQDACIVANAVAEETAAEMGVIMKSDPPTNVERAEVSQKPISPNLIKNTAIGFLLGALLVCAVLVIRFLMNDNIKTEEDIEKYLGLTTLVAIPYIKKKARKKQELKELRKASDGKEN